VDAGFYHLPFPGSGIGIRNPILESPRKLDMQSLDNRTAFRDGQEIDLHIVRKFIETVGQCADNPGILPSLIEEEHQKSASIRMIHQSLHHLVQGFCRQIHLCKAPV